MLRSKVIPLTALVGLALTLLFLRRGTSLSNPQVWNEDGFYMIPEFLAEGWLSLYVPVQGYLISSSRLITNLSLTLFPQDYPLASTVLVWLFTALVIAYVYLAPSVFRAKFLVAISCLALPTDPEAFGLPLYSFWWTGLILFILVLWEEKPTYPVIRGISLIFSGLSSPLIVMVAPLFAVRAYRLRSRLDISLFFVSGVCALVQLYFILTAGADKGSVELSLHTLDLMLEKFFGLYLVSGENDFPTLWVAAGCFAASIYGLYRIPSRWFAFVLLFTLAGSIALSVARVDLNLIHPVSAGPRYFFYPYIVLSWIFIQALVFSPLSYDKILFGSLLLAALMNSVGSGWSRDHDDLEWHKNVASCAHFESYEMPIQYTGDRALAWYKDYPGDACKKMMDQSSSSQSSDVFPFRVLRNVSALDPSQDLQINLSKTWTIATDLVGGSSYSGTAPAAGVAVLGSYVSGDGDQGSILINMDLGGALLFTSGPGGKAQKYLVKTGGRVLTGLLPVCTEWCVLEFSSQILVDTFEVTLMDAGSGWGEWFAIALPSTNS